ncbi:MAG: helix-turn-helix transcriptional regulator [Nitrospirae bacterium]|nr:helix-turn-helix transcriptional regulator [Nitrospirota bacterium]
MITKKDIGNLIRRLRKVAGMTQMELAEQMNITYQQVQKYEKGVSELTIKRLRQVADALNVPVSTFIPDDSGVAEPDAPYLTEDETNLLTQFRKLRSKKLKEGFVRILKDMTEMSLRKG